MSLSSQIPAAVKYPNQPLKEVSAELRFYGEPNVEAKRGDFFELVREIYPLVFVPPLNPSVHPALQHYRFEKENRNAGISLAINSIGYFQREYEGADAFISEFKRIVGIAKDLFGMRNYSRIGWRYINTIAFARVDGQIPLEVYFKNPPSLFSIDSNQFSNINFYATTKYEEELVSVRLLSGQDNKEGSELLIFDIDVYQEELKAKNFNYGNVSSSIERLHNIARNFFEESITDNYRKYLQDEKYV